MTVACQCHSVRGVLGAPDLGCGDEELRVGVVLAVLVCVGEAHQTVGSDDELAHGTPRVIDERSALLAALGLEVDTGGTGWSQNCDGTSGASSTLRPATTSLPEPADQALATLSPRVKWQQSYVTDNKIFCAGLTSSDL